MRAQRASKPAPGDAWRRQVTGVLGEDYARQYAERFDRLAAAGEDVHGEARFLTDLVPPGSRVLDAGCGTGRVAARLAELGYDASGVDVDEPMVAVARQRAPELDWHVSDLTTLALGTTYDLVVLAGNVVPFIDPEDLPLLAGALARHLDLGGLVVSGFGLAADHLPPGVPVVPLAAYDQAMAGAGFELSARHGGWDDSAYEGGGYAVSVHRRG